MSRAHWRARTRLWRSRSTATPVRPHRPLLGGRDGGGRGHAQRRGRGRRALGPDRLPRLRQPGEARQVLGFRQGVRGVADAATNLWLKGHEGTPVPVISGNVSLYNESARGTSVAPSAIIACVGICPTTRRPCSSSAPVKH